MKISISEIGSYLACRRQWYWSSPNGENRAPIGQPADALWLGTGVHAALEAFYSAGIHPVEALRAWSEAETQKLMDATPPVAPNQESIDKSLWLGSLMLAGYMDEYGVRPELDIEGLRFIACEQEFSVPIPGTLSIETGYLVGRMDGIAVIDADNSPDYWVVDHKTATSFPRRDSLSANPQFTGYAWAATMLAREGALPGVPQGATFAGTLYNGLRKQAPGPSVRSPLFMREYLYKGRTELINFEQWLAKIHDTMVVVRGHEGARYPTFGRECDWCAFIEPCRAKEEGGDWEWALLNHFQLATPRGTVYAGGEEVQSVQPQS